MSARAKRNHLVQEIAGPGLHCLGIAAVLLHHALAERLSLGATDQQCRDLLAGAGFREITSGPTRSLLLGFVRGTKATSPR